MATEALVAVLLTVLLGQAQAAPRQSRAQADDADGGVVVTDTWAMAPSPEPVRVAGKVAEWGQGVRGDVTNDGLVNVTDALVVATYGIDSSVTAPNAGSIALGDVNADGRINVVDALMIATYGIDPSNRWLPSGIGLPWLPSVGDSLVAELPGGERMVFMWVPPGTFLMGSPDTDDMAEAHEKPQHPVTLSSGYWLGRYEVTQGQWQAVTGTSPWVGRSYVQAGSGYPASWVTWNDVQGFLAALNGAAGDSLYRLPTEAEWEYACRAGTSTRWSFGEEATPVGEYAWYHANAWNAGEQYAHVVGSRTANAWGFHDMHGNVWEWVQDRYAAPYPGSAAQTDPSGPATGTSRVIRGGGFGNYVWSTRSALRYAYTPSDRYNYVGVRILRRPR